MRRSIPFLVAIFSFAVGWVVCLDLEKRLFAEEHGDLTPRFTVRKPVLPPSTISATSNDEQAETTRPIAEPKPTGDWPQWGGDSMRNNVPTASNLSLIHI